MERDKIFFRYVLLHYFDLKKTAAEAYRIMFEAYGEQAPSKRTCREWFQRFRSGDFRVKDKVRSGQPKKFQDEELLALLEENSSLTLDQLAKALNVTPMAVSKRIQTIKQQQEVKK